jgi:NAD(P)H-nitrite reductase large subunit
VIFDAMTDSVNYLILGGGVAGVTAAEAIRQRDASGTIRILGEEKHAPYSRVLLPHVVTGKVPESKAYLKTPAALAEKGIGYVMGAAATRVDSARKTVVFADGAQISYDKLLIATGGSARKLACPGAAEADCLSFQTMDDARALAAATGTAKALVYGGGFIALEVLMSFAHFGTPAVAVMRGDGFFSRVLDPIGKKKVLEAVSANGIDVVPHSEISAIDVAGDLKNVHLSDGRNISCTAIALGIGLEPNVGFLEGSGIGTATGVLADSALRSPSSPDVFAAGDVAEFDDAIVGARRIAGNWQSAMFQGQVAGANMAGAASVFSSVTSYGLSCFGLPVAVIGATDVPVDERIVRETAQGGSLQLFLKGARIVGATCVGPFSERAALTKLITTRKIFSSVESSALREGRTGLDAFVG